MRRSIFIVLGALIVLGFGFYTRTQGNQEKEVDSKVVTTVGVEYNPANEIEPLFSPFDSLLDNYFKTSGTVGAAVVVSYKGQIAFVKCFGVTKVGGRDSIDQHTIFRLASVSKTITGVLSGILDDEGLVSLDDNVTDYLPDFHLKTTESTNLLKVRNLLSQTSGVVPHAFDLMVEDKVPLKTIISRLDEADISALPGELYTYQNVVYSVYQPLVEAETNMSFQQLMKDKVFEPFGMNDASLSFQSFKRNKDKAYPHSCVGAHQFRKIRLNDRYYSTTPAAGVNASIADLGNFLAVLTNHDSEIFSDNARNTVFTPQIKTNLNRVYFRSWGRDAKNKRYAIGWRVVDYKGHEIAYHGGFVNGYKSEIALCNDEKIGIAILCNSPNRETAKSIPAFLNMFFNYNDCYVKDKENNAENVYNQDNS